MKSPEGRGSLTNYEVRICEPLKKMLTKRFCWRVFVEDTPPCLPKSHEIFLLTQLFTATDLLSLPQEYYLKIQVFFLETTFLFLSASRRVSGLWRFICRYYVIYIPHMRRYDDFWVSKQVYSNFFFPDITNKKVIYPAFKKRFLLTAPALYHC
jgi:hypothetical protein